MSGEDTMSDQLRSTKLFFKILLQYAVFRVQALKTKKARWLSWLERRPVTAEVVGSSPIRVACLFIRQLGEFPSGQRGQTVNLLAVLSVVRIHLPPLARA